MLEDAILIQTFGTYINFDDKKIEKTEIDLITKNNEIINLFSISDADPHDKLFSRDLDGMQIMSEKWFNIFSKYKLIKHIHINEFDYDSDDIKNLSFKFLMEYDK